MYILEENRKNNRTTQFLRNIGIYAIGGVGSRLITFLLVPIYSFFIAPENFGYYDICFTIVMLFVPLISLDLREGAFRFLIDADSDEGKQKIVTMSIMALLANSAICVLIGILMNLLFDIKYLWYTVAFAISFSLYDVVTQMLRALGHTKLFAITGILSSFLVFAVSVPLVAFANMGIEGVFIGNIVARVVALMLAEIKVKIFSRYIVLHTDVREVRKRIFKYSLPLAFVSTAVVVISSGNRFFIERFCGLEENGMYAVAIKFAVILETIGAIIIQAWQESAIRGYSDDDKSEFYTKIYNAFVWVVVLLVISISYGCKLIYGYVVGAEYQRSVMYVYPLVASSMLLLLVQFYDMAYQCSKHTMRQVPCLVMGIIISVMGNYFFIQWWGMYGAIVSINVTYLFMLTYKVVDTRKYMALGISVKSIVAILMLVVSCAMYYFVENSAQVVLYLFVSLVVMMMSCPKYIMHSIVGCLKKVGKL